MIISLPFWGGKAAKRPGWGTAMNATDDRWKRHAAFARARTMRAALTPQEARVWSLLKGWRARGVRFRRQAPFRGYYLDFVCFSRRLVVEIDGGQHGGGEQAAHDAIRDAVLAREGFRVLRFWNHDVNTNFEGVAEAIWAAVEAAATVPHPAR